MGIIIEEKIESREQQSGDSAFKDLQYVIFVTDDLTEDFIGEDVKIRKALELEAPESINLDPENPESIPLLRQSVYLKPIGGYPVELWEGAARYAAPDDSTTAFFETPVGEFSFDTAGGTVHIVQSLEHIGDYAPAGQTARNTHGAIGVTKNGEVQGIDLPQAAFPFVIPHYVHVVNMTAGYLQVLRQLTKRYNDDAWQVTLAGAVMTFEAGEVLLDRVTASYRSGDIYVPFQFSFLAIENETDLVVSGITIPAKKGWDLLTVDHVDHSEDNNFTKLVDAVHLDRVFKPGDFSLLGLS